MGKLVSIQVGKPAPKTYERPADGKESQWTSGIDKAVVSGSIMLRETNLDGDGQADGENHGGPHRAVLMYSADHYGKWSGELERAGIDPTVWQGIGGAFGENFTVAGFTEDTVCIGDTFQIGDVVVQASQPRQPCWKLGRKHRLPELPALVERLGWSGWYVRVLQTGMVEAGLGVELVERLHPQWTIRETTRIMRERKELREEAALLADCRELSTDWRNVLRETD